MATAKKTKRPPKHSHGRPTSTAMITQPTVQDTPNPSTLSSFSPRADLFAHVSPALDKHRLCVYNTSTGQAIADYIIDNARVSSLAWGTLDLGELNGTESSQPNKKKRKKDSIAVPETRSKTTEIVFLGLSDGSILCFSPSHGRALRSLSHTSSTSAILAVAVLNVQRRWLIWTSGQDAMLRLWDANKSEMVGNWNNDSRIPYTALAIRSHDGRGQIDILSASHSIQLSSFPGETERIIPNKLPQLVTFTGHASSVTSMKWDPSEQRPTRFISMAEADRFLYVWDVSDLPEVDGRAIASIPLESNARSFSLSTSSEASNFSTLLTLSASGRITLYPIPRDISSLSNSPAKLPTLLSRSSIFSTSKRPSAPLPIINVSFVNGEPGNICIARLAQGIQLVFDVVSYLDESGEFIQNPELKDMAEMSMENTKPFTTNKRYNEAYTAVGSGIDLGHDEIMDETTARDIDGDLEIDLADLSLGQRLAAVTDAVHRSFESEEEETILIKSQLAGKTSRPVLGTVPANSLTRTLIQALHSSDTRLIETCLAHSNTDLIRNTIRRIPSQLAIPLLTACVERLGRGARATNMKGGGAGASAQRGMTLVTWIKTVLAIHTGYLMTVPDLVARLSGLHTTLNARLALQESLLSLSGRLDMVLSQIEMRSRKAPAPLPPKNGKISSLAQKTHVKRYIEGETDSSNDENGQVDVEAGDDEGSIENIELGGNSEDEEGGDGESDDDEFSEGSGGNEFVDDEAEEYSDAEDDESE